MATSRPTPSSQEEEKSDCLRLLLFGIDGGTMILRYRFDQIIPPPDLQRKLNEAVTRLTLADLRKKKVITEKQWSLLYPHTGQPSSEHFDISLLTCLLQHICGLDKNSNAWTCIPPSFNTTTEADIKRLRDFRNKFSHMKTLSISKQNFVRKWNNLEQVITRLGAGLPNLQQEVENFRSKCLDPEIESELQAKIEECAEMDKLLQVEIAGMKADIDDCIEKVKTSTETVEDIQNQTAETTSRIKSLQLYQETNAESIKQLEVDKVENERKISNIEQTIEKNAAICEDQHSLIYECLEACNAKADTTASLYSLQSTALAELYTEDIERDDFYVTTQTHKEAKEKFIRTGCVILSGLPGEGKTTMATRLLSETTQNKSYYKLSAPSDWSMVKLRKGEPSTIFIDDIFGSGVLNETWLEEWSRRLPDIEKAIQAKAVRAIITTRHYILKEAKDKLRDLKFFKDENVQILASVDLTDDEQTAILESHLRHKGKDCDSTLIAECIKSYNYASIIYYADVPSGFENICHRHDPYSFKAMIGFPEVVSLFVQNEHLLKQGSLFFEKPYLFFKKCVDELFQNEDKFLALILVWTSPKKQFFIKNIEPPHISDEITNTAKKFGIKLKLKHSSVLRRSFDSHKDGLLRFSSASGTYYFSHNTVKDMVGLVAGTQYTNAVLEYADMEFLLQFVTTDEKKNDGLHIYIDQFRYPELLDAIYRTMDPVILKNDLDFVFTRKDKKVLKKFGYGPYGPFISSENEIRIHTSVLKHDCFSNSHFVKHFCSSKEGKYLLSKPVELLPKSLDWCYCDFDLGEPVPIYLPSLGLLYKHSLLVKEFLNQKLEKNINTSQFLQTTMLLASHVGFTDVVAMLLQRGAEVNEESISFAAVEGHPKCLEYLLQSYTGKCTDFPKSRNGNSLLIFAAKRGNVECMNCLIRHGNNVNYRNKNGWSALDKAVLYEQSQSCELLLKNGAHSNCKTGKFKRTPLHMSADIGDIISTKLLLQYGASIKVKDYRGHYPIHCATFRGYDNIVELLLKEDLSGMTTKQRVSYGKNSSIKGAYVLHIAVLTKNVDLIKIFLQNGFNPNVCDFYGRTPIYLAVYGQEHKTISIKEAAKDEQQLKIVNMLLQFADVRIAERNGYTPLHAAVHKGKHEIVKALGPYSDANAKDKYGQTPLHTACHQLDLEIFRTLVDDFRADFHMRTNSGQSVFDILKQKSRFKNVMKRERGNRWTVARFKYESPPFKSFRDIIAVKDPEFV